ncbi:hypothetical protein XM38_050020 [Halomicronema hongdechloris C2206]|uniref:Uncharacterized protein n=1 Tax=Halomicronema hongdechloris C2206 TaxID=1641165 RepID=A0A1Z3HUM9_9CYAN|nr:hypothetical protein [Halomicronema hongdechloris]ASC74028.1 hypothetical protein XM38_050020 [Halomicronema hongdechloris C2206]
MTYRLHSSLTPTAASRREALYRAAGLLGGVSLVHSSLGMVCTPVIATEPVSAPAAAPDTTTPATETIPTPSPSAASGANTEYVRSHVLFVSPGIYDTYGVL